MSAGPLQLVLATANADKVSEIVAIMADAAGPAVELIARPQSLGEVEETGDSLIANARIKAVAVSQATGRAAIADDTELEVEMLGGAPGVYSARFAGEHATYADNVAKLLAELEACGATGAEARRARFVTVAMAVFPGGEEVAAEGFTEGTIAAVAQGAEGFGYDPVFVPDDGDGRTFAQMSAHEKHALSHRGRAFRALAAKLIDP